MANSGAHLMRGYRSVVEALRLEDYPMDKEGINYSVGDVKVEDGAGGWVAVRNLTDGLKQESFVSAEEIVRALRKAAEGRSKAA